LTDRVKYWAKLDDRFICGYGITGALKTPVNFILHTLQEVNDGLSHGRYSFMDVARDGIALYEFDDRWTTKADGRSASLCCGHFRQNFLRPLL
jgi:hypothetical protein